MATALDFITQSMRKSGILSEMETPTASQAADALSTLNDMLDSWANDGLLVPYRTLEGFPVVAGTQAYTIGASGDFDTSRPLKIISAYLRDGTVDSRLSLKDDDDFAKISVKSTQGLPECINFTNAYPLAVINLFPVPNAAFTLYLLSEKIFGSYSLSSTIALPPGWNRAVKSNLSVELCNEYGQEVPQGIASVAADSLSKIKSNAAKNRTMDFCAVNSGGTIYTGWAN